MDGVPYPTGLGIDQLRIWGVSEGATAFAPDLVPDEPRLLTSGTDTLVILVPDGLATHDLAVRGPCWSSR